MLTLLYTYDIINTWKRTKQINKKRGFKYETIYTRGINTDFKK